MLTPWKDSYDQPRQHNKKQRHYLPTNVCLVKAMVFTVVMYECESWTIKKAECRRIDAFELWCWKTLESPLEYKEIQPVHPKGHQCWIFIGKTHAESEFQSFVHLMQRTDSLEITLMLGKIEGRVEGDDRGWDEWMAYLTSWTWLWMKLVMDSKAWHEAVHGVAKSLTRLTDRTELSEKYT